MRNQAWGGPKQFKYGIGLLRFFVVSALGLPSSSNWLMGLMGASSATAESGELPKSSSEGSRTRDCGQDTSSAHVC